MRIKNTSDFKRLVEISGIGPRSLSRHIVDTSIELGFIKDQVEYYGLSMKEHCEDTLTDDLEIFNVLLPLVGVIHIDIFHNLITIGDDECEMCGSSVEHLDGEYIQIDGGYDVVPQWKTISEKYSCINCDHITNK